jgi:hypothetical protein
VRPGQLRLGLRATARPAPPRRPSPRPWPTGRCGWVRPRSTRTPAPRPQTRAAPSANRARRPDRCQVASRPACQERPGSSPRSWEALARAAVADWEAVSTASRRACWEETSCCHSSVAVLTSVPSTPFGSPGSHQAQPPVPALTPLQPAARAPSRLPCPDWCTVSSPTALLRRVRSTADVRGPRPAARPDHRLPRRPDRRRPHPRPLPRLVHRPAEPLRPRPDRRRRPHPQHRLHRAEVAPSPRPDSRSKPHRPIALHLADPARRSAIGRSAPLRTHPTR